MNKIFKLNYPLYLGFIFVAILLFLSIFGPMIAPHLPTEMLETQYTDGKVISPPIKPFESESYPLGTDRWGYDILSMILHGLRYTVFVALAVTLIKMFFGTLLGLYIGTWKKTPGFIIAFENAWSYVPLFLILYFFMRPISFNSSLEVRTLVGYFIIISAVISIPSIISSIRLKTAELYKSDYIEAAKVLGAKRNRLIWRHIFPLMKESLLITFIMEIVYVITIMGQLSLVNIFIGGTTVRFDPLIYLSITKEISGLVGQARGSIYGNTHILMIPLIVLLFTTISFSLLANGLKNRFQSNYARAPWIQTGQKLQFKPIRKQYEKGKKFLSLNGENFGLGLLILLFIGAGTYVYITKDANIGVKNDNKATYDLKLEMANDGVFATTANIQVKNKSKQEWDELVFYFIPNVFTKGHSFTSVKGYSEIKMKQITVNGQKVAYQLEDDTLKVILPNSIKAKKTFAVKFDYTFTVPKEGVRLSKEKDNYYLAQWYPMLATFQNGKWNKEAYSDLAETYHTDFSDYQVSFKLQDGYSFVSSADRDAALGKTEGKVSNKKIRDFFIAIMKDMEMYETVANDGVKIRLFTRNDHQQNIETTLDLAKDALKFYQERIGKYPHKQLDIVLDNGVFMEYPGIVTINPYIENLNFYQTSIVHEIAHQYFYGVVSNDQFNEAWIDEGITEFATSMYFYVGRNEAEVKAFRIPNERMSIISQLDLGRQYSNTPVDQVKNSGYIYGQPPLELKKMIKDKYMIIGDDEKDVGMQFLSDYYHHFRYKEVDTQQFIQFTKSYFSVPTGYFNRWLNTAKQSETSTQRK